MRIVLVHGINNQGSSEQAIIDEWLAALSHSLSSADMAKLRRAEIVAPYYGDVLYDATRSESKAGPEPVAQSAAAVGSDEAVFYRAMLEDMAPAAGVTEADIRAQAATNEAIEQGLPHDRRLLAVLRALEKVSPFHGRHILRFLPQAFVYLNRVAVARDIEKIVRPSLEKRPCVIVGHSLGTIVTFKLLREEAAGAAFYVTLGSPLAVRAVMNAIGPVFARPDGVSSWLNGLDLDDAVTIGRSLTDETFGPGIVNINDIDNGNDDPHDIRMYLSDRRIAEALVHAV
jgi:pimeloyl-ACP methyl ester carboxylesterase